MSIPEERIDQLIEAMTGDIPELGVKELGERPHETNQDQVIAALLGGQTGLGTQPPQQELGPVVEETYDSRDHPALEIGGMHRQVIGAVVAGILGFGMVWLAVSALPYS